MSDLTLPASGRMTREQAATLQSTSIQENDLLVWVVTENPSDYPGKFIARPASTRNGGKFCHLHLEADTLEDLRDGLPCGLTPLARDPSDNPVVVESWI